MSQSMEPTAAPTVAVSVVAADPGAQIVIIDASFRQVALGVGRLNVQVDPGIYKARFKAGDRIEDKLFEVRNQPVTVKGDPLRFSSPIPLHGTSNNHEYHYFPSRDLAAAPPTAVLGVGAEVFVFARDSRQKENKPPPGPPQWAGLRIRNADHLSIFEIHSSGKTDLGAGYASVKLMLNPGLYFLEQPDCAHPDMMLELPFVVCDGWCTHVYVDSKDACTPSSASILSNEGQRVLDLGGAGMVMLKNGQHAGLADEMVRLSEIARQGLMRAQEAVSDEDLDEMIHGKKQFPMLGLYAAHVLLNRRDTKWDKVAMIAGNLAQWLGSSHPDIDVLLELCRQHGVVVLDRPRSGLWPPVLAPSWDRALQHGIQPPDVDARGDWLHQYRIGGSLWSCLYAPLRLPEFAASGAIQNTSFVARAFASATQLGRIGRTIGMHVPDAGAQDRDWKQIFASELKQPEPNATPFNQAVRRRVLDLLQDPNEELTLSDLGKHVVGLASQFRVPADQAGDILALLKQLRGQRTVAIGGDSIGSVITVGDDNRVDARLEVLSHQNSSDASTDLKSELRSIRAVLERIATDDKAKIARALDDAVEEAAKPDPDKDEVGVALERALKYAKASKEFAEEASNLVPHLSKVATWLGANWHKLLSIVGVVL